MSWEQGIDAFFNWLRENFPEGVILVAHGAFANDAPLIVDDLQDSGWSDEQIQKVIVGFCDTLHAFTKNFPGSASFWINHLFISDKDCSAELSYL